MPLIKDEEQWKQERAKFETPYTDVSGDPAQYPCWAWICEFYTSQCRENNCVYIAFAYLDKDGNWDMERLEAEEAWRSWGNGPE